jgi:hypothetical protein
MRRWSTRAALIVLVGLAAVVAQQGRLSSGVTTAIGSVGGAPSLPLVVHHDASDTAVISSDPIAAGSFTPSDRGRATSDPGLLASLAALAVLIALRSRHVVTVAGTMSAVGTRRHAVRAPPSLI